MSGKVLVIIATVAWGVWGIALKKAAGHMPPFAAYIACTVASLLTLPAFAGLARNAGVALAFPAPGVAWSGVAALSVGIGTVAVLFAMRVADASAVVALTSAYPVVTMLLAVMFLGEALSIGRVAGVACVAVGAFLLSR